MSTVYRRTDVCAILQVSPEFVVSLESEGIVTCHGDGLFTASQVDRIRVSWNLHSELGVNLAGIDVALMLLDRLDQHRAISADLLQRLARLADGPETHDT